MTHGHCFSFMSSVGGMDLSELLGALLGVSAVLRGPGVCGAGMGVQEWGGLHGGKPGNGQPLQRHRDYYPLGGSDQPSGAEVAEKLFGQRIWEPDRNRALRALSLLGLLFWDCPRGWDSPCACSSRVRAAGGFSNWGRGGGRRGYASGTSPEAPAYHVHPRPCLEAPLLP